MAMLLVVAAEVLTVSLSVRFSSGPTWIDPLIEAMLPGPVIVSDPARINRRPRERWFVKIGRAAIVAFPDLATPQQPNPQVVPRGWRQARWW